MCEFVLVLSPTRIGKTHQKITSILRKQSDYHGSGSGHVLYIGRHADFGKTVLPAKENEDFRQLMQEDLDAKTLMLHIRRASFGATINENAHPFVIQTVMGTGPTYAFMHNGTLYKPETIPLKGKFRRAGTTDSERAFHYIMENANGEGYYDNLYAAMRYLNGFGKIHCVFSNGTSTVAYADANDFKNLMIAKDIHGTTFIYTDVNENTLAYQREYVDANRQSDDPETQKTVEMVQRSLANWKDQHYMREVVRGMDVQKINAGSMLLFVNAEPLHEFRMRG